MSTKQQQKLAGRRAFFRKAGAGIAAAAAAGVSATTAQAMVDDAEDRKAGRYRETEHVKKAYETARF